MRRSLIRARKVRNGGKAEGYEQRKTCYLDRVQREVFGSEEAGIEDRKHAPEKQDCPENSRKFLQHLFLPDTPVFCQGGKLGKCMIEPDLLRLVCGGCFCENDPKPPDDFMTLRRELVAGHGGPLFVKDDLDIISGKRLH